MLCPRHAAMAIAIAVVVGGCGLIDEDVTDFDLSLPTKTYSVDSASWDIDGDPATVLNMSCGNDPSVCALAADNLCTEGQCEGACNSGTQTCDVIIPIAPFTTIDLAMEKPELSSIDDQALVDVEIETITYSVGQNSLDRETPPLVLYVAPENVMTPSDARAVPIGTIPPVAPMSTIGETDLEMTSAGRERLILAMQDFRTPFNVLVATELVVGTGQTIPTGRMTTSLTIRAHAGL